ncbi:MAG TPA: helix-turn-helix domain-containing protein [Baekduia sp.]|nr:helix-turn-helix domain-containing protein [Baekduia sp.]
MDTPGDPTTALSQPTRARLFSALVTLRRPAHTNELADSVGLHPNGVRLHLEQLVSAGLVARTRPIQGVGRPRDLWSVAPGARPSGEAPTAYADIAGWLAAVTASGRTSKRAVEQAGREIGRRLAPGPNAAPVADQLRSTLSSLGFAPELKESKTSVTIRLCNCPYRDAAVGNQEVVCTLHRGLTRGLLDEISPALKLRTFDVRDPVAARCTMEIEL